MEIEDLLSMAKDLLKEEMTSIGYTTWIQDLEIKDVLDNNIILKAKSIFQKDALENRYHDLLINTFKHITNKNYDVSVILDEDDALENKTAAKEPTVALKYPNSLNPNYTFDTFVVGGNNSLAQTVALSLSEAPSNILGTQAELYNPLFLYGGVGLRKNSLNARNWK